MASLTGSKAEKPHESYDEAHASPHSLERKTESNLLRRKGSTLAGCHFKEDEICNIILLKWDRKEIDMEKRFNRVITAI